MRKVVDEVDFVNHFIKGKVKLYEMRQKELDETVLINDITVQGMFDLFFYFQNQEDSSGKEFDFDEKILEVKTGWYGYKSFKDWYKLNRYFHDGSENLMFEGIETLEDLEKRFEVVVMYEPRDSEFREAGGFIIAYE